VNTNRGYRLHHGFDMSDTNSRKGLTIPIWRMRLEYLSPLTYLAEVTALLLAVFFRPW